MRDGERGRDMGRGRSRLSAGSPRWGSILGPWDHDLSQRQMLNQLSHPPRYPNTPSVLTGSPQKQKVTLICFVGLEFHKVWHTYIRKCQIKE